MAIKTATYEITVDAYRQDVDEILAALPVMIRFAFSNTATIVTAREVDSGQFSKEA